MDIDTIIEEVEYEGDNKLLIIKHFWYLYDKYGVKRAMDYLKLNDYQDDNIDKLFKSLKI